jgi:hypothetical protein
MNIGYAANENQKFVFKQIQSRINVLLNGGEVGMILL